MDESSGRGYIPFTTRELDNPGWSTPDDYDLPDRSRHGTVLSVTKAELNRIRAAIPPATSISANEHRLTPDDRAISWLFA